MNDLTNQDPTIEAQAGINADPNASSTEASNTATVDSSITDIPAASGVDTTVANTNGLPDPSNPNDQSAATASVTAGVPVTSAPPTLAPAVRDEAINRLRKGNDVEEIIHYLAKEFHKLYSEAKAEFEKI